MPEQSIIFRDLYEVTQDDLNNLQTWKQDALDHVVLDTIDSGNAYSGFAVDNPTSTSVRIAPGRLYYAGKVYFNDTQGGSIIDVSTLRPSVQAKIVAIVAAPQDQQTDVEERDFEIDATTETFEPRSVAMIQQRWASLQAVPGPELVSPTKPVVPTTAVILAYVTMTTAGITAIEQVLANQVPNLDDVDGRTTALETEFADVSARTKTIADDLAALRAMLANLANLTVVASLEQDVARLKAKANLPASYVNYREDDFIDASKSDPTYSGYTCTIGEGLRFAPEAIDDTQLQIFNPFDPLAKVSGNGLLLPTYNAEVFRIVDGIAGQMSLTQYSYQTYGLVQATMSRQRVRFGAQFEEAASSAFFSGGTFGGGSVTNSFAKSGETFQVYDTTLQNPDGQEIYRLRQYWLDTVTTPYWQRLVTAGSATGYAWCQTFLQNQGGWCVGLHPSFSSKPTTGAVTIGICGTDNGLPDLGNILAQVTLNPTDLLVSPSINNGYIPIEPTYLEAGKRYGFFIITGASYSVNVADIQSNGGGTCFYALDGGIFYPNPSQNIMFNLQFAAFPQNRVSINLGSLSLSGGIAAIDLLADTIVPPNTVLTYEIQVNGDWFPLAEASAGALATLPPLVPLRVSFTGTANIMPGLRLSGSQCTVSRPKTAFKRGSVAETLASPSSTIVVKSTLVDYDPAHHSFSSKVKVASVLTAPSTTTPVILDARTTELTETFHLGSATSSYVLEDDGATDSAANLFHVASVFEVAE